MGIEKHIKNLEEYCEDDIDFRSQTAEEEKSDFDIFCDNHIADIKAVIEELKNIQSDLGDKDRMINEMAKYIDDFQMECNKYYKDKEDVIKTFEERCKNAKD